MQIVERRLDELKPYPQNPRVPGKAVERVAESIKQFGWRQPIVVDEETGPVHVAEGLSDEQKRAYRLADNRLNEYARWEAETDQEAVKA